MRRPNVLMLLMRQRSSTTCQRCAANAPKRSRAAGAAAMRQRMAAALGPADLALDLAPAWAPEWAADPALDLVPLSTTSGVRCGAAARFKRRLEVRSSPPATTPATMAGR